MKTMIIIAMMISVSFVGFSYEPELVKKLDSYPRSNISNQRYILYNGYILFFDNDGKVWKTDGTATGTTLAIDVGRNNRISEMVLCNEDLFFTTQHFVWKSDGTQDGSIMIHRISNPRKLTVIGDMVLYYGEHYIYDYDVYTDYLGLWKYNNSTPTDPTTTRQISMPIFNVTMNGLTTSKDKIVIQGEWPSDVSFNPDSEKVSVWIGEKEVELNDGTWKTTSKGWKYKGPKGKKINLTIDNVKKDSWVFKMSNATVADYIDLSEDLPVSFKTESFELKANIKTTLKGKIEKK